VSSDLSHDLARVLEGARRSYAAFRPEVAAYLFEHGWKPTANALPPGPHRGKLLENLWHLQLESIGSKMFGVSTDAWRDNPAYPDRYFPIVWLDIVPKLLPRLPPERQLPTLVSLFNLGEHLVIGARSVGALVAEAVASDLESAAREGVEAVVLSAMVDLGLIPKEAAPRRAPRTPAFDRIESLPPLQLADFDARFLPAAVGFDEKVWWVADRTRPLAFAFSDGGDRPQLLERRALGHVDEGAPPSLPYVLSWDQGRIEVWADGRIAFGAAGSEVRAIGAIDLRALAGLAVGSEGRLLVTRRFSQRVELYALRSGGVAR
jgi:hypothetical protein